MKHFGQLVLHLKLDYLLKQYPIFSNAHHWRAAERLIFEHCTVLLMGLQLVNCRANAFEEIRKPLENVTRLQISGDQPSILKEPLGCNKWFPAVCTIEKRILKLPEDNDDVSVASSMNQISNNGGNVLDAIKSPVNMTDLHEYCLESIFKHLNANDLTNIADTCEYFASTARLIYKRKYSEEQLFVSRSGHNLSLGWKAKLDVTLASFMKHFGKLIKSLIIVYGYGSYGNEMHHWRRAERLISEHCADTLECIRISGHDKGWAIMEALDKPFNSVEEIHIDTVHRPGPNKIFGMNILEKMFPKLIRLTVKDLHPLEFTNGPLRHLKEFNFNPFQRYHLGVHEKTLRTFLEQNSHIEKLSMFCGKYYLWTNEWFSFLSESLPNLEYLDIDITMHESVSYDIVQFKSVKSFVLRSRFGTYFPDPVPFRFDNLVSLEIRMYEEYLHDEKWSNFILQNRGLVELKLEDVSDNDYYGTGKRERKSSQELFRIVSNLPELKTLHYTGKSFVRKECYLFLKKCKSLIQLTHIHLKRVRQDDDDEDDDSDG